MKKIFIDTNYFVRLIENDVDDQVKEVKALFEGGLSGKISLYSSVIVLFEIYWLLSSYYRVSKKDLTEILRDLLSMTYVKWEQKEVLLTAVCNCDKYGYDLEDSYNACYAKLLKVDEIASFDKKLIKVWSE